MQELRWINIIDYGKRIVYNFYMKDIPVSLRGLFFLAGILLFPSFAIAQEIVGFTYPRAIGVDEKNHLLYVTQAFAPGAKGNIFIFDTNGNNELSLLEKFEVPTEFPTKVIHDPSTSFTYIIYMGTRQIVSFDGDAIRQGKGVKLNWINFYHIRSGILSSLDVVPVGDGERIFIVQFGMDPKIIMTDPLGNELKTFSLDRTPLSVVYHKTGGALFVSYGVGFSIITKIILATGEREEILLPYSAGQLIFDEESLYVADALGAHLMMIGRKDGLIETIDIPFQAHFLGLDRGNKLYFANYFINKIGVINQEKVLTMLPLQVYPITLKAVDEKLVIVGHNGFVEIVPIDGATSLLVETLPRHYIFGAYQYVSFFASSALEGRIYLGNEDNDAVVVVDIRTGQKEIIENTKGNSLATLSHPVSAVFWKDKLFVANFPGFISVFERDSEKFLKKIFFNTPIDDMMMVDDVFYVASGGAKLIYLIDPSQQVVLGGIRLDDSMQGSGVSGSLRFLQTTDDPKGFYVYDEVTGAWAFIDPATRSILFSGRREGLIRPPTVTDDIIVFASFTRGNITIAERRSGGEKTISLPDGSHPLYISVDQETSDIIVLGINELGDAAIFVVNRSGVLENSFAVGRALNTKASPQVGAFTGKETVFYGAFNNIDDAIWVFFPGRIHIYDKAGIVQKTILYSDSVFQFALNDDKLYLAGGGRLDEVDLTQSMIMRSWNFSSHIPLGALRVGQEVLHIVAKKDDGIAIIPGHDTIIYYNYKNDTWHTILGKGLTGAPEFIFSNVIKKKQERASQWFIFFIVVLAIFMLFCAFFWRRKRYSTL